ncbi:MAG: GC-type dockerin domain-anchored protein [Planctomycetota bacterium]
MNRSALAVIAIVAPAAAQPIILVDSENPVPSGTDLPSGAAVTVVEGGAIGLSVDLSNGSLDIQGGEVAVGATSIASGFTNSNNTVTISGGRVGPFFQFFGSTGAITGGELDTFGVFSGSTVTVSGGTVAGFPDVFSGGVVVIEGGDVNTFRALAGSTIELIGTAFTLDGQPLAVAPGQTILLTERSQTLNATLADGSSFSHALIPFDPGFPTPDVAVTSAAIFLTAVDPACNIADLAAPFGFLDLTDVDAFINAFSTGDPAADIAAPFGFVDLTDIDAFITAFTAGCP